MKILLVEDSATLRHAMSQYITEAGHSPLIAHSGEEALQLLENTPVDMIIMDVEMPGLNGFETTRLIREWLAGHWIPIIFVTSHNGDESYQEGIEAGGDDYLVKPVSPMIIKAKIRAMERISEMRDQLHHLNQELEALSQLDSLTQILNRRTFNERGEQQWLQATRQQSSTAVLMIDVDHFKLYNDHYGHPAGDACLQQVTAALRSCVQRPYDLLGRYGGEEFVILLPETDMAGARQVASCINAKVRELALKHEVSPTSRVVTVSVGGAVCSHPASHSLEEIVKCADRALYRAKHGGRDQAVLDEVATHKTVLILDPDQEELQHHARMLRLECNIITTDKPDELVEIALDVRPDLIIMDAVSADEENNLICRDLTRDPSTATIPILLLSAHPCQSRPISDASVGIRGCLEKPLSKQQLLEKIHALLY